MDRDQAHRLLRAEAAEALLDAALRQPEPVLAAQRHGDEVAVEGIALPARRHRDLAPLRLLVDGHDPSAPGRQRPEDAQRLGLVAADHLDDPADVAPRRVAVGFDLQEHPVAGARSRPGGAAAGARHQHGDEGRGPGFRIPLGRPRDQLAVAVAAAVDVGDDDRRQAPGLAQAGPVLLDRAVLLHLLDQALQLDLVRALDTEGLGDLALADLLRRLLDEGEHGLAGRQDGMHRLRVRSLGMNSLGQQVDPGGVTRRLPGGQAAAASFKYGMSAAAEQRRGSDGPRLLHRGPPIRAQRRAPARAGPISPCVRMPIAEDEPQVAA